MDKRVLVLIRAFNEQDNIVAAVEDVKTECPDLDYIVINDGSSDDTHKRCVENGFPIVSLPINTGLDGAFQTGMKYAYQNGYDVVVQFDGDGQHYAKFIRTLIEEGENSDVDIVIGSRFHDEKKPFTMRMLGSRLMTFIIKITTRKTIEDPTSGMRLYKKNLIDKYANAFDLGAEADTLAYLMNKGVTVKEVQVQMKPRVAGTSYFNISKSMSFMLSMCLSILFFQWFRKN